MSSLKAARGTARDAIFQFGKRIAFRSPLFSELTRPSYSFGVEPAQLAWLCNAVTTTLERSLNPGCIVEVGVARGMTSVFMLEHLKCQRDPRPYYCLDTFSGFTSSDIDFEVTQRGKNKSHYRGYRYNHRDIFEGNLARGGYSNFNVRQGDAAEFDWTSMPPIDVMLIDVDLYKPTLAVLRRSFPRWSTVAHIMVDDVKDKGDYDGAFQAYMEYVKEKKLPVSIIGTRGGIIVR